MKSTIFYIGIALSTMLFAACNEAPVAVEHEHVALDLDQIRAEIQGLEDAYAEALSKGDLDAIMSYYGDDIVSYSNNEPMVSGKEAFRKKQEADMAKTTPGTSFKFEVMDIFAEGDLVVETGKSTTSDAEGNITRTGKYMCVFMKRDGKYECIREMYNDDKKE
jgi:ketosteroid isomerase-like protein